MPDKSIVLFDWEVRALADGRKSMKRVPARPQAGMPIDSRIEHPYKVGDKLWVKEAWASAAENKQCHPVDDYIIYRATDPEWGEAIEGWRWRPALTMPRWTSRYTIIVTEVMSPEHVQDITAYDCFREGCPKAILDSEGHYPNNRFGWYANHWAENYAGRRGLGWNDNPWVWPFRFELARKESE